MAGPWFTTPWRLVSQSRGAVAWRFLTPIFSCSDLVATPRCRSPLTHSVTGPTSASRGFAFPWGCCAALATPLSWRRALISSLVPCSYPVGPQATQWRGPTGSSSIRGLFRAPCTGCSFPIPFSCALGAFPSGCSCPGHLATFPMPTPLWPTCVSAREHSASLRLWPSRDATTHIPLRAGGEVCSVCLHRMWSCRP